MRRPSTLIICLVGATTTTTTTVGVSAFQTCGIARCGRAVRLQSRGASSSRAMNSRGWAARRVMHRRSRYAAAAGEGGDEPEIKRDDNFGSEDYSQYGYEPDHELQQPDPFADEEQLAKWRHEKLLVNDKWQFNMYGKQNVGNWLGSWQEYVATELRAGDDPGIGAMIGVTPGSNFVSNTRITRRGLEDADAVNVFEHVHEPLNGMDGEGEVHGPVPVIEKLFPDSFRGGNGTQVAGNTYTIAAARSSAEGAGADDLGDVWVEVGLRAGGVRMRCMFQYGRGVEGASVWRVYLAREGLERLPSEDEMIEEELYGPAGKGLYDTPPQSRSPLYFSIYAQGGLTIRFPLKVETGQGGVFSVDWTAGSTRYQADRVFDLLDGSCRRLEVTEIGTEDAEIFLPEEKF